MSAHDNQPVKGSRIGYAERFDHNFLLFCQNPNTVFSKEELLGKIWYGKAEIGVVAVLVLKLRRKIGYAESVFGRMANAYGSGYCLTSPGEEDMV